MGVTKTDLDVAPGHLVETSGHTGKFSIDAVVFVEDVIEIEDDIEMFE